MNQLQLFLPCAAGVEDYLAPEVLRITGLPPGCITKQRGGVAVADHGGIVPLPNCLP